MSTDGSLGGGVFDSRIPADAKPVADAVVEIKRDAAKGDATVEAGVMMDQRNCDLIMQNCPKQAACYPAGLGGSRCEISMLYNITPALCAQDAECAPGYFCGGVLRDNRVCVLICDRRFLCGGKDSCVPINGFNDVGYCRPN